MANTRNRVTVNNAENNGGKQQPRCQVTATPSAYS
jgi:hypothetical protein